MDRELQSLPIQIKQEITAIKRRLYWLNENDKEQQMEIENLWKRILNDFPVEPWNDE